MEGSPKKLFGERGRRTKGPTARRETSDGSPLEIVRPDEETKEAELDTQEIVRPMGVPREGNEGDTTDAEEKERERVMAAYEDNNQEGNREQHGRNLLLERMRAIREHEARAALQTPERVILTPTRPETKGPVRWGSLTGFFSKMAEWVKKGNETTREELEEAPEEEKSVVLAQEQPEGPEETPAQESSTPETTEESPYKGEDRPAKRRREIKVIKEAARTKESITGLNEILAVSTEDMNEMGLKEHLKELEGQLSAIHKYIYLGKLDDQERKGQVLVKAVEEKINEIKDKLGLERETGLDKKERELLAVRELLLQRIKQRESEQAKKKRGKAK